MAIKTFLKKNAIYQATNKRIQDDIEITGAQIIGSYPRIDEMSVGAADVALKSMTTIVSDDQIKSLHTTPVELVPAPGVNKSIAVVQAIVDPHIAVGYPNVGLDFTYLTITYEDDSEFMDNLINDPDAASQYLSPFFQPDGPRQIFTPRSVKDNFGLPLGFINNKALQLFLYNGSSGDLTGGDPSNFLTVTVIYHIVDI